MWKTRDYNVFYQRKPQQYLVCAELFASVVRLVRTELGRKTSRRVTDVGCGTGMLTRMIAAGCDAAVIGVDFSKVAIKLAREARAKALKLPPPPLAEPGIAQFKVIDFNKDKLPPADICVANTVLEHLDDDRSLVKAMLAAAPVVFCGVPRDGKKSAMHVHTYDVATIASRFEDLGDVDVYDHPANRHWILFGIRRLKEGDSVA